MLSEGALSMFVYVMLICPPTPGVCPGVPAFAFAAAAFAALLSKTNLSNLCAMFPAGGPGTTEPAGVPLPEVPVPANGVEDPELFPGVASIEAASRLDASEMICFTFLFRR
jgi:hypothetical protein